VYLHHNKKVTGVLELFSETDFVSRNDLFTATANDIAMQVASMNPKDEKELLSQEFIKDPSKKISDLVRELIAKTGENIRIGRFYRVELGK
jgi:elongation factor Ts